MRIEANWARKGQAWTLAIGMSVASGVVAGAAPDEAFGQTSTRAARAGRDGKDAPSETDFAAAQMLGRAKELIAAHETERGVKVLETILEQSPASQVRFKAYLELGKYHLSNHDHVKAIGLLRNVRSLESPDREVSESQRDVYLESLYLMGVAYFESRQYSSAFPVLRRITDDFPNTVWANQSYYYIGMCHFAEENWNKAIEALSLVGTFVDPKSPSIEFVEAGRRFYVKVVDGDLPVIARQGQKVTVSIETKNGDKEKIELIPLPGNPEIYIGSIPTELAIAKANNNILEVTGGDIITTTYVDANDKGGEKGVARVSKTRVVSTGVLSFMLGDLETRTNNAFVAQPLFVVLQDSDLDKTPEADKVSIRIVSRAKLTDEEIAAQSSGGGAKAADISKIVGDQDRYKIRDEVTVPLTEQGTAPVHSGRFAGKVDVQLAREDKPVDKSDNVLSVAMGDEIVAFYTDELHIGGETPRDVTATAIVVSEIENTPRATQYVVNDPVVAARKNLVEGSAYLELGRIFKSMGLMKGATEKANEGLDRVDSIIRSRAPVTASINEQAFKLKWELQLVKDDFNGAIATCELFNRLYPESPFVDQALMGIGQVKLQDKKYDEAIEILRRVVSLPNSQIKAEAQFRIAEATEAKTPPKEGRTVSEAAIAQYKLVADRYRDSEFAGPSLAKLVDYYIETKDYTQANDLLTQIFQDYPDASFLDSMMLKWVMVAYRMGDFQKAHDKCAQLLFEYPSSRFAEKAKAILPKIEERLNSK